MARKLKDSSRVEAKKKRRLKRIRHKGGSGPSSRASCSLAPLGMEKMSDVLEDFVSPFFSLANTIGEFRRLFSFGVAAWNTALLPEQEQETALEAVIQKAGARDGAEVEELRDSLKQLILRKKACFATNRRMIVGFELIESGDGFQLNVMSTLPLPAGR
jgi:hypothetical protein